MPGLFPTTRWTRIIAAQRTPALRRQLLGELLEVYWRPLYLLARRSGLDRPAAEDAVQGLWLKLLEHDSLDALDRERGSLRGYLRTALQRFIAGGVTQARAQKRGGGQAAAPLDFDAAEGLLARAPATPEAAFEREWALAVVQQALGRLREEFERGERRGGFEVVLQVFGFGDERPYREVAQAHGMSVTQLKAFAFRARGRFRALLEEVLADTLPEGADAAGEARRLWEGLAA